MPRTKDDVQTDSDVLEQSEAEMIMENIQQPSIESMSDIDRVNSILDNNKIKFEDKLIHIANSDTKYASLAKSLIHYQDLLSSKSKLPSQEDGAMYNYTLYAKLIGVCEEKSYTEFKVKFDIVNLCFLVFKDDAYNEFKLFRFSNNWKYGIDKYKTYRAICILVCVLCDIKTRPEILKQISFATTLTQDGTKFTETSINNIRRYYMGN